LGATPAEAVSPTSVRIRALMVRAISTAGPNSDSDAVTSRKASSRESGSTSGVKPPRMPMISADTRAYFGMSTGRKAARGQRR